MTATPRHWFRIHLSTAVVLMFVAGGLLWLNLESASSALGWPFYFREILYQPDLDGISSIVIIESWSNANLILDVVVAAFFLVFAANSCEMLLCRAKPNGGGRSIVEAPLD
jgi:hypothetical protein